MSENSDRYIEQTRCWIEQVVVRLNLCPFARRPFEAGQVRYVVSEARTPEALLADLQAEFELLRASDPAEVETTVLIHPYLLNDFLDYNDFLDLVDLLIEQEGYSGEFQVATLHPDYQFAGTDAEDVENYTNRAPYPTLHLLREAVLAKAIAHYPNPEAIPQENIATMERLGREEIERRLEECRKRAGG